MVPSVGSDRQSQCEQGYYSDQAGQRSCTACRFDRGPAFTTLAPGSTRCDACVEGFYMNRNEDRCAECDSTMDCPVGRDGLALRDLSLRPGHHRLLATTDKPYI